MRDLTTIIQNATQAIEESYFRLKIAGGDPVYRERVYCYELYHQMRLRWPKGCEYYLNGEVVKASHPKFQELGAGKPKPDFLIHQPGRMSGNHAIIEVKGSGASKSEILNDLGKLDCFVRKYKYQRAIYLFFGSDADKSLVKRVQGCADEINVIKPIEIWIHRAVGESAEHNSSIP